MSREVYRRQNMVPSPGKHDSVVSEIFIKCLKLIYHISMCSNTNHGVMSSLATQYVVSTVGPVKQRTTVVDCEVKLSQ